MVSFAQSSNIGIIKGIWFSEDIFFAQDTIRIYTAIQNNSGDDIQGTVEFFDNDISIGTKNFTALDNRLAEIWIDTVVSEGKHDYSVTITEAAINRPGEAAEPITPRVIKSDDTIIVDVDTDGDNIGDKVDTDDDNDGFSDSEEKLEGTDPLNINSTPEPVHEDDEIEVDDTSFLNQILDIISDSSDSGDMDDENVSLENDEKIYPPEFIQNIEKSYPVITQITQPINNAQNNIIPKIKKEKIRISELRDRADILKTKEPTIEGEVPVYKEQTEFTYWMYTIYQYILSAASWVFSCLLCMIVLMFVIIHILLKLVFRIFRNRFGYIRS